MDSKINKIISGFKDLERNLDKISGIEGWQVSLDEVVAHAQAPLVIIVMGAFSTGKSEFINALVGKDITAVRATPTTAVITKLKYGEEEKVIVHKKNNTIVEYATNKFEEVTAVGEKNTEILNDIAYVEREMPLEILRQLTIIDSPGLNDVNEEHSKITEEFVENADAVLWMFSSQQVGTQSEFDAMKKLTSRLKPIALINKMDLLDEEEDSPEEFLEEVKILLGEKVQAVIGISAKYAIEGKKENNELKMQIGNLQELDKVMNEIVLPRKEFIKINTVIDEFGSFIANQIVNIAIKKQSLEFLLDKKQASIVNATKKQFIDVLSASKIISEMRKYCKQIVNGNPQAMFFMALLYEFGISEEINLAKGEELYQKAGYMNHLLAQVRLVVLYKKDNKESKLIYWLKKGAEAGNDDFKYWLGVYYLEGKSVNKNIDKGLALLKDAQKKNILGAVYYLGICYLKGIGVIQDKKIAYKYVQEAANNGYPLAQYELGKYYEDHLKNDLAIKYYNLASKCGNMKGIYALGKMLLGKEEKGEKYLEIAAEYDIEDSQFLLAEYYRKKLQKF